MNITAKIISPIVLMWLLPGHLTAQPDTLWSKAFGGMGGHTFYSVKETHDDGFIAVGETRNFIEGTRDYWLVKTDSKGELIWEKKFGGANAGTFRDVEQTADSGYIIIGYSVDPNYYVARTDSVGNLLWEKTFGGGFFDWGEAVLVLDNGDFLFAGFSNSFDDNGQARLIRTDLNGDTLWTRRYGGGAWDNLTEIKKLKDGGYIITGLTHSIGSGLADFWLMKLDSNFNVLWETAFGGPETDIAHDVIEASDGGFVMTGRTASFGAGDDDLWIVKTNSEGDSLWAKTFGAHKRDRGFSITEASTGGYIVTGSTGYFNGGLLGRLIIRTDENGDTLWTNVSDYRGGVGFSIIKTTDDWFVVAGNDFTESGPKGSLEKIIVLPYPVINTNGTWKDGDLDGYADVTLDGTASYSAERFNVVAYEWRFEGEVIGTDPVISYRLPTGGNAITLTVTDETGITGFKEDIIIVATHRIKLSENINSTFTSEGDSLFYAYTENNSIIKFNSTGDLLWSTAVDNRIRSALTLSNSGILYAATEDSGLYAFNLDGNLLFRVDIGQINNVSPALDNNGNLYIGNSAGDLYSINGDNGSVNWIINSGAPHIVSPAVSRDGVIYVNGSDNSLLALNQDGSEKWSYFLSRIFSSPALDVDGNVYIGGDDKNLYKVSPTGDKLWSVLFSSAIWSPPVLGSEGEVYFKRSNGSVHALSSTGEILWTIDTAKSPKKFSAETLNVLSDRRIVLYNPEGELILLDPDGNLVWSFKTNAPISHPPLITNGGIIHLATDDSTFYGLALPDFTPGENSPWHTFQGNNQRTGTQGTLVSVRDDKSEILPTKYSLKQNYPNPFNPVTSIEYDLPLESHVLLTVYNLNGQEIARLTDEIKPAGRYKTGFDASGFSSGIYIYRIQAKNYSKARKMLLLK